MQITVDIAGMMEMNDRNGRDFLLRLWREIAVSYPDSLFHFLYGKGSTESQPPASNVTLHVSVPKPSSLRYRYWELLQLPAFLKKTKSDLLVSSRLHPLADATVPQVWMAGSVDDLPNERMVNRNKKSIQQLIVYSEAGKQKLIERYGISGKKIRVFLGALPSAPAPLSFAAKQEIKAKYSEGKEYFIYPGPISSRQNLLPLFKGFSIFKKRQQSGIKLLLADEIPESEKSFIETLKTYKYRDEVIVTGRISDQERNELIAAAYAIADPSPLPGPGWIAMQSAAAGVALLAAAGQPLSEEAYLNTDMYDPVDIASRLMQVYKDESLRNQLIREASAAVFPDIQAVAAAVWTALHPGDQ